MQKAKIGVLAILVGAIVYFLDPAMLWSYDFDDDDMRPLVEGRWRLTLRNDPETSYELEIRQHTVAERSGGWIRSAAACGSRSFVRSASACATSTRMPLQIAVVGAPEIVTDGVFSVNGRTFQRGDLVVVLGTLEHRIASVNVGIDRAGKVSRSDGDAKLERITGPQ